MERITLNPENLTHAVQRAKEVLSNGGVVLIPTETVYGLVCKFENRIAEEKIYQLKLREKSKRFAAFVSNYEKLIDYGLELNPLLVELANSYTPGKITIIGNRKDGTSLGFRVPDHEFVLALLSELDYPLSSTSANVSGEPNILHVDEALTSLNGEVDLVIDAGAISAGALASTVVDATNPEKAKILRQGELIINRGDCKTIF